MAQEKASKRLQKLRAVTLKRVNKSRIFNPFKVGDFALVHNNRWPQHKWPKFASPWQGPFKVLKVFFTSLQVMASPSLGGVIDVALHMCKKWDVDLPYELLDADIFDEEPPLGGGDPRECNDSRGAGRIRLL